MKITAMKPSSNERCIDCANYVEGDICHICEFIPKQKTTNADRIRAMTDEELAEFINGVEAEAIRRAGLFITVGDIQRGKEGWLNWLREEATD